jgi:hypothetical protein
MKSYALLLSLLLSQGIITKHVKSNIMFFKIARFCIANRGGDLKQRAKLMLTLNMTTKLRNFRDLHFSLKEDLE